MKGKDVESQAVFKAESVLRQDDTTAASTTKTKTQPASRSQPKSFWNRYKFLIVGVVAAGVAIATAFTAMSILKGRNETSDSSNKALVAVDVEADLPPQSSSPTFSPSASPSVTPQWGLDFQSMDVDFSVNSDRQIILEYKIGIDREVETEMLASDCISPIEGLVLDLMTERSPATIFNELLTLKYSIKFSTITESNVWVDESNSLQLCQLVRLVLPSSQANGPPLVISEEKRRFEINIRQDSSFGQFDLTVQLAPAEQGGDIAPEAEGLDVIVNNTGSEPAP